MVGLVRDAVVVGAAGAAEAVGEEEAEAEEVPMRRRSGCL